MGVLNLVEGNNLKNVGVGREVAQVPEYGAAKNLTTSGTTARTTLPNSDADFVRVATDTAIYINFGDNTVEAAAGDIFILANSAEWIPIPSGATHIAAIDK